MGTLLVRGILVTLFLLTAVFPAWAQESKGVGVVTALTGRANLKRPQAPETPLKLRDNLFVRDVVDTQKESLARILLLAKATVTVRELSRFQIREEVLPDGGERAVIDLAAGKIRVMVARRLMKPGDEVLIRTPNALASVRGSDGIFEVSTLRDGTPQTVVTGVEGEFDLTLPRTRPFTAMAEVASDAGAGILVAQAPPGGGPVRGLDRVQILGAAGLQQITRSLVSLQDVLRELRGFQGPSVGSGTGASNARTSDKAVTRGEQLAATQTTRTGATVISAPIYQLALNPVPQPVVQKPVILPTTSTTSTTCSLDCPPPPSTAAAPPPAPPPPAPPPPPDVPDIDISGVLVFTGPLKTFSGTVNRSGVSPVVRATNSTVTQRDTSNLIQTDPGARVTLNGSLLVGSNSTITGGGDLLHLSSTLTAPGPLLDLTNTALTVPGAVANLLNGSTLTVTSGPAIRISGGSLSADAAGISDSTGNTFNLTGTVLDVSNGATVTLRTLGQEIPNNHNDTVTFNLGVNQPVVSVANSTLTLTGAGRTLADFGVDTGSITQGGVALIATGTSAAPSTISLQGRLLDLGGVNLTDPNPQVQLTNTTLTQGGSDPLIDILLHPVTMAGPALKARNSTITAAGAFLHFGTGTFMSNTASPFVDFDPSTASSARNFVLADGGAKVTLHGSLLDAIDLSLSATSNQISFFAVVDGASVTTSGTASPLLNFGRVASGRNTVTAARNFLPLAVNTSGSMPPSMTLSGPLLNASLTDFKTGDPTSAVTGNTFTFLFVGDSATLTGPSGTTLMSFDNSTVDTAGNILTLRRSGSAAAPSRVSLSGPLFSATNGSSFNTTSLGFGAAFSTTSAACCNGFFLSQGAQLTAATTSPLISLVNSTFNAGPDAQSGGTFFGVSDTSTGFPSGELVAPSSVQLGNASVTAGSLLKATDSTISALFSLVGVTRSSLTSNGTDPLINLIGTTGMGSGVTTVTLGTLDRTDPISPESSTLADVLFVQSSAMSGTAGTAASVSLAGPLLSATNASLTMTKDVVGVFNGATLSSTTTAPLIQLTNTTLSAGSASTPGRILTVSGAGGPSGTSLASVSLRGGLLSDPASSLTLTGGLAGIFAGGMVTTNSSTDPFVSITGGSHSIATNNGTALFQLQGRSTATAVETDPDAAGLVLGTDQPIQHAGVLLETSGGASIGSTTPSQSGLTIDPALLQATAPLFHLKDGSSLTSAMDLVNLANKAKLTANLASNDALVKLNASTLTINNGSLVNVTGGSFANVTGNLLKLTNTSTVSITGGALVTVSGGSVFKLTGGSLGFFGSGTNTLNITNNTALCGGCTLNKTILGVTFPVFLGSGVSASQVQVASGFVPFANLTGSNSVSVSGASGAVLAVKDSTSKIVLKP